MNYLRIFDNLILFREYFLFRFLDINYLLIQENK